MIFQLAQLIANEQGIEVIVNGAPGADSSEGVYLTKTGGEPTPIVGRTNSLVQLRVVNGSRLEAYSQITTLYESLVDRYNLTLPNVMESSLLEVDTPSGSGYLVVSTTEGDVILGADPILYPAIEHVSIVPIQDPGYIGTDRQLKHSWSVNFNVTLGG